MPRDLRSRFAGLPLALTFALAGPALADSRTFSELPGKKLDDALGRLAGEGYQKIGTEDEHGSTLHYLWNSRLGDCEVLSSRDGRVRDVSSVSPSVCNGISRAAGTGGGSSRDRDGYDSGPLPKEVTGLVGNKRDDAEDKLAGQGFQKLDGDKAHGSTSGLWWNRTRQECLSVESKDGRVRSIRREPRSSCD